MVALDWGAIHNTHDIKGKVGLPSGFGFYRFGTSRFGYFEPFAGVYQTKMTKKGRRTMRERHYRPTNPRTIHQQNVRSYLAQSNVLWQNLTLERKTYYNELARRKRKNTGHQLFISCCLLNWPNVESC
jgi:hypothetical protein